MISILFTQPKSIYETLGVDCWDLERNALNYAGSTPVVCHPPCRAWSRVRGLAKPLPGEKGLAFFAIDVVRKNGGVLEHPSSSTLFPKYLPLPGSLDEFGGYSICVDQFWWGHLAQKKTLLYIVGVPQDDLPPIPISFDCITHVVGSSSAKKRTGKKELSKRGREATPLRFAEWLIQVATLCKKQN